MLKHHSLVSRRSRTSSEAGYTVMELMVSVSVLLLLSAGVFNGIQQSTTVGETVTNRAEMHAGVRNATELLQQEVGQAGRVVLPGAPPTLAANVLASVAVQAVAVSSTAGMFVGEKLVVDTGASEETVAITAIDALGNVSGIFTFDHAAGAPVSVQGGFASGVVPTNMLNGSTATTLKMYGDINGDGNMVYIEYVCDTVNGFLYRNALPYDAPAKAAPNVSQVLLNNIQPNPGGTPCFTYQEQTVVGTTFVTDVAITLTVQTQRRDPLTGLFQLETKALLNVAPRNVFQVWQMATMNMNSRVQPMPPSVLTLLPPL